MTEKTGKELKLKVDTVVYPLEAIQAAAYTMTDRAYVRIARDGGKAAAVSLKPKTASLDAAALSDEFHNELLHEALRLRISQANKKIREFIVTKALVSAQVPGEPPAADPASAPEAPCPECEAEAAAAKAKGDPRAAAAPVDAELEKEIEKLLTEIEKSGPGGNDPLGVTVPWEKKFGAAAGGKPSAAKKAARPAQKVKGKKTA